MKEVEEEPCWAKAEEAGEEEDGGTTAAGGENSIPVAAEAPAGAVNSLVIMCILEMSTFGAESSTLTPAGSGVPSREDSAEEGVVARSPRSELAELL